MELQLKDELMRDQEGTVIIIRICQYQQMGMLFGAENCNMLMAELGQYFFHLGGKFHVFRSDADTFVVMTDKDRYQEMVKSVEGRSVVRCFRQCGERACDRDGCADDRGILQTESD